MYLFKKYWPLLSSHFSPESPSLTVRGREERRRGRQSRTRHKNPTEVALGRFLFFRSRGFNSSTGWRFRIELRKWNYCVCGLRDVFLISPRQLPNRPQILPFPEFNPAYPTDYGMVWNNQGIGKGLFWQLIFVAGRMNCNAPYITLKVSCILLPLNTGVYKLSLGFSYSESLASCWPWHVTLKWQFFTVGDNKRNHDSQF